MSRRGEKPAASLPARARAWLAAAQANPCFRRGMLGAAGVVALDQASKAWIIHGLDLPERQRIEISPVFDLTYVQNYGASFGMLAGGMGSRILLSLVAIGVAAALTVWLGRLGRTWAAAGCAFVIGGALGNLIDRVRQGFVTDFLDFSGLYFPWVFNVADAAINVGVACLVIDAFLHRERKHPKGRDA
ncbi:signal peptidase II [Amphiplicatus metriothermophilus]|uniref:Lipoprotein signal peptidase n=1 Tax=Amphiplicatus metriothermophilus TaxID=1519374 RepID=A0A239PJD6_9PROT|nr:signal peptidase II [Amphiplicatus metriothermophilus]MBB5517932.1 signal peptidase II [Amphiplicatus metriothermophilus]SNT67735.1 signal peptidase II [Amphiplicatus metriothermophilus]